MGTLFSNIRLILCLAYMLIHLTVSADTITPSEEKNISIELLRVNVVLEPNGEVLGVQIYWELTGAQPDGNIVVHRVRADGIGSDPVSEPLDYDVREWIDTTASPSLRSESYYVVYNEVDGTSHPSDEYHHTIFLQTEPHVDECEMKITLRWDDYVITNLNQDTLPSIFGCNKVFVSVDGGEEIRFGLPISFGQVQHRVYTGLVPGSTYQFRIQACMDGDDTLFSYSNPSSIITFDPDWPETVMIHWVSVTNDGVMQLNIASDGDYPNLLYNISRSRQERGPFSQVSSIPLEASVIFDDPSASPDAGQWFYKLDVVNECDSLIISSPAISGIFLSMDELGITEEWIEMNISWEHSPAWPEYVLEYSHIRSGPFLPLNGETYMAPGSRRLNEPVRLLEQSGELFLRMSATDGSVVIYSNVIRLSLDPEVSAPNAFRPDSHLQANREFRPKLNLTPSSYELRIYNRWQQMVFSSTDPAESWDGTWRGEAVPEGVYAWVLEYQVSGGRKISRRGSIMLVR